MEESLNPIPVILLKDYSAHSEETFKHTLQYFATQNATSRRICSAFCAFGQACQVYPVTEDNFLSGERVPIIEAQETHEILLFEVFTGMYKISFHLLRELLELVLLQFYLYLGQDRHFLDDWLKGESDTPYKGTLKSALSKSQLYQSANEVLNLDRRLDSIYRSLCAYTHTQGVAHSHQGLKTSNRPVFSESALQKFSNIYFDTIKYCVSLIAIHCPNAIIGLPVYDKFGYGGPICLIDEDQAEAVRAIFTDSELSTMETLALNNDDFQEAKAAIEAMPDLTKEQIDQTWNVIEKHMQHSTDSSM